MFELVVHRSIANRCKNVVGVQSIISIDYFGRYSNRLFFYYYYYKNNNYDTNIACNNG